MALNSTMNISIAVIQNLFLYFHKKIFSSLKNIFRLKGLLYLCLLSPTPSRAELYLRVRDPNLIPFASSFCSKLWKWIQKEEEQPIIGATTLNINGQENFSGQILTTKIRSIYVMLKKLFGDYIRVPLLY